MNTSKISITIPSYLLNFINFYSKSHNDFNRSGVIQKALELLREQELGNAYKAANAEIDHSFDITSGDGIK